MIYKCDKCHKEFNRKSNYKRHLDGINDCVKLNITICNICNKEFSNKYNLSRHQKNKQCNKNLLEKINNLENKIKDLENTNNLTNIKVNNNSNNINNINNNINNNNINSNNHTINIIKFGTETLLDKFSKQEIEEILSHGYCALHHSIKATHFNSKYPEMQNIYIADKKFKYANIYDGTDFILDKCENVLFNLIDNHRNNIEEFLDSENINVKPKIITAIKNLISLLDSNEKQYEEKKEEIIDEIKLLLYNNRKKVIDTHNIRS